MSRPSGPGRTRSIFGALIAMAMATTLGCGTQESDAPAVAGATAAPGASAPPSPSAAPVRKTPRQGIEIGEPVEVSIGTIGVEAPVLALGMAPDGAQAVPSSLHETGWWDQGARPGQNGNAVIVGHAASRADGVFDDLGTLARGDEITVTGADGSVTFEVRRTFDLPVEEFDSIAGLVYRRGGDPGLVVMTCGGWNGEDYEATTIVMAELVD